MDMVASVGTVQSGRSIQVGAFTIHGMIFTQRTHANRGPQAEQLVLMLLFLIEMGENYYGNSNIQTMAIFQ